MDFPSTPAPRPLRDRLRDGDAAVRLGAAAEAFQRKEPPAELREELAALLADALEDARKIATLALGRIGPPAFGDLARALDPAQPAPVRAFACQAAAAHGREAAPLAGAIARCLESPEEALRDVAAVLLPKLGPDAVPHLLRALDSRSSSAATLVAAANAAGALGTEAAAAAEALRRSTGHPEPRVALACADALGRVTGRPANALPALVEASRAADEGLRAEAVRRLGALRRDGRGAERTLFERSGDPSPKVRAAAAIALALVGAAERELGEALGRLLDDAEPDVRVAAAAAAAHARDAGRLLLPRIERLRVSPEPRTAAAAKAAFDLLAGGEGAGPAGPFTA